MNYKPLINISFFSILYSLWPCWGQQQHLLIGKPTRLRSEGRLSVGVGDNNYWHLAVFHREQFEKLLNCGGMRILQYIILEYLCPVFVRYGSTVVIKQQYYNSEGWRDLLSVSFVIIHQWPFSFQWIHLCHDTLIATCAGIRNSSKCRERQETSLANVDIDISWFWWNVWSRVVFCFRFNLKCSWHFLTWNRGRSAATIS